MSKKLLPRRTFLKGFGMSIGLPLLDAMVPLNSSWAQDITSPQRFLMMFFPNGYDIAAWNFNDSLSSLKPFLDAKKLSDFSGQFRNIEGPPRRADDDYDLDPHIAEIISFATAQTPRYYAFDRSTYQSVDIAASKLFSNTRSIQLARPGQNTVVGDLIVPLSKSISYDGALKFPTTSTLQAFQSILYGAGASYDAPENVARRAAFQHDRSVLDFVLSDVATIKRKIGKADQRVVDIHLQELRALELEIHAKENALGQNPLACQSIGAPADNLNYKFHHEKMLEIIHFAFKCDVARSASLMLASAFGDFGDPLLFQHLGITQNWHEIQHLAFGHMKTINKQNADLLAGFLTRMNSVPESNGTMLDNCVALLGGGFGGGSHNLNNLPIIVAGRAGGRLKSGLHSSSVSPQHLANLYLTLLKALGSKANNFGPNSSGLITSLLA